MIFDRDGDLLPGLLPASFRGIPFFVPDTTTMPGRRVAEYLFPGIDRAAYDDLGLAPLSISIEGMIVGDDYVGAARRLQAAFERPGPGTLVHPWLGAMQVILSEPAEISFSSSELRVARFSATFKRTAAAAASGPSRMATFPAVLSAIDGLLGSSRDLAASLSPAIITRIRATATRRASRAATQAWGDAMPSIRHQLPQVTSEPMAFARDLALIHEAVLSRVATLNPPPAVAPAAEAPAETGIGAAIAFDLALGVADLLLAGPTPTIADHALGLASTAAAIGTTARIAAARDFGSRQEAIAARAALTARLDGATEAAAALALSAFDRQASALSRALSTLRHAVIADINEAIGRLDPAGVFEATAPVDAFELAHHLYGDDPAAVEAGYRSLVERNRCRHPALLPAGPIEVNR